MTISDRRDAYIALLIALIALMVYTRVLAPDVLFGDSGEFQTLAYTGGITHPTGYPIYLILARFVGLIPVNSLAWRINFASALAAGIALGGVYLLARRFTTSRAGALIASLVLMLSYTFWSQSIIAEVYTPAAAFIVTILRLVLAWQRQPHKNRWLLCLAGLLIGAGWGVHLFVMLIAPAVGLFVLGGFFRGGAEERWQVRHSLRLIGGGFMGLIVFYLAFAFMDARPTPANFFTTSLIPSRDIWQLPLTDLDSTPERFWLSVSGFQWRDAMLPANVDYGKILASFFNEILPREYARSAWLLAALGALVALALHRRLLLLVGSGVLVAFAAGFAYQPPDKYLFYLPVYVLLAVLIGAGAGFINERISRLLPARIPRAVPEIVMTTILVGMCVLPFAKDRWNAIRAGRSLFITEDYVYPVRQGDLPRRAAECAVEQVSEANALLVLDWQALYAIYYVAHVEQGRTDLAIYEARPHGTPIISDGLVEIIESELQNGRIVYTDNTRPPLGRLYTLTPVTGVCLSYPLFKVTLREN